jgi:membrane protein YdbS with pleckstrin-like domain
MSWTPLDPSARWLFHLSALSQLVLFWWPVSLAAGIGAGFQFGMLAGAGVGGAAALLTLVASLWLPALAWSRWAYALRERELLVASGVIVREVVAIPFERVQHVDVRQGPLDQLLNLARVEVYTASGMGADGVIPGLRPEVAAALRDRLVAVAGGGGV